jgi:hypothetical protein
MHWVTQFFETRKGFNTEGLMARELLCKWVDQNRFAGFEMDREEIRELIAPRELVSISDFLARLLNSFGTRKGKASVGSLTPAYTQIIQAVHGLWPQAKFIHVIQDGRDLYFTAKSHQDISAGGTGVPPVDRRDACPTDGTAGEDLVTAFALAWRRKVKHGQKAGKCLGPGLYHELLIERLLNDPEEELSRLSAFLGIGDNDGKIVSGEWLVVSGEEGGVPPTTHHSPLTTHLSWRSEIPAGDLERLEAGAGDLLEELGYPRLAPRCPPEILNHAARIQGQFNHPPGSQTPSTRSLQRLRRKNAWTNPFVFIVGCPRSGTTLLQRILNAHSDLAICPESFWIVYYFKKQIGLTPEGLVAPEIISRLFEYYKFYRMKMDRKDLELLLGSGKPISYAEFVSGIFDAYADYHGKPLAGDKTPDYVRNLPTLHQLWPKAKIVHLIRDGRDVALSAINWTRKAGKLRSLFPTWSEHPVATAAAWWKWHVEPARDFGRSLGKNLYCELHYEELIANPEKESARLCVFLGLPFEPAMLRFHEGRTRIEAGLDAKNAWRPITPGLRNWRQQMAPEAVELFEAVAGGLLHELGYPRAFPQPAVETLNQAARIRKAFDHESQLLGDWLA